ncbi:uncharacterized protein LACBIDRAFT_327869 [Laccaria bicolor S238N-H82]|uniref:Predicted protein n=1 Tax=Laccaria bicolor (strain S238N-H82 / ATCC MYA-4686) TaxID=486041 RepID=B0DD19_LACBS|nr:uncharacterized protein LACBIDRAFT_327869 [Laccaria bicolor S238N-H82]EDR07395.1 predicted protein [Laccaria bicolor S238N-H82]|eukprot:XP_001881787.1 predicted protein [Laccaria bicolor S238N-H82]
MFAVKNLLQRLLKLVLSIFLSSSLRSWLARLLLGSCFTCIALSLSIWGIVGPENLIPMVVLNVTILSHHSYVMTKREALKEKPRFGSLVDFILTTAECTFVPYFVQPWSWYGKDPYEMPAVTFLVTSAIYVQIACLCLLLMAIDEPSGVVTKPFDFYAMTKGDKPPSLPIHRIVAGPAISHDQHKFVPLLRRSFVTVIALVLLAFSFTNLVFGPVQEAAMSPYKIYTTPTTLTLNNPAVVGENWRIVACSQLAIGSSLEMWDNKTVSICAFKNLEPAFQAMNSEDNVKMVVFDCPLGWPDVLITVNFTTLGINGTFPSNSASSAVSIVVGMYNDTGGVIRNTWPIPLVPDAHLFGGVIATIREQFRRPGLASLGIFSSTEGFYIGAVPFLSSDPSLQVPRHNNTATLRLYLQDDYSDWHVSVEYREKSVLSGLAAVGGFWTVLNGLFATIFGTTLLPDEPGERYRNLCQSDKGMLDYIHDHFVDLSPFEGNRPIHEITNPVYDHWH